jgi:hypothetical protein
MKPHPDPGSVPVWEVMPLLLKHAVQRLIVLCNALRMALKKHAMICYSMLNWDAMNATLMLLILAAEACFERQEA